MTGDVVPDRRAEWHRYYSRKRIVHQWQQLDLLSRIDDGRSVLEIGPYLGAVTALAANAGYRVTTLDHVPPQFASPATDSIVSDLLTVAPERLAGHDVILCSETLEHLPWDQVDQVLRRFWDSGVPHLIVSVPYMGLQLFGSFYANAHGMRSYFSFKKMLFLRRFTPEADPFGHKWEVGYKGHSLSDWEAKLSAAGYAIRERAFTAETRSVFHTLRRQDGGAPA